MGDPAPFGWRLGGRSAMVLADVYGVGASFDLRRTPPASPGNTEGSEDLAAGRTLEAERYRSP